jgi:hypothetical protein
MTIQCGSFTRCQSLWLREVNEGIRFELQFVDLLTLVSHCQMRLLDSSTIRALYHLPYHTFRIAYLIGWLPTKRSSHPRQAYQL